MLSTQDVTDTLNHLLEVCRDRQRGFAAAAAAINQPVLKAELLQYVAQTRTLATELEDALTALGHTPSCHGTMAGALHRGWMSIRSAASHDGTHAVLAECQRADDWALGAYRQAFESDLPASTESLVELQFDQVRRTHERIKSLCEAHQRN